MEHESFFYQLFLNQQPVLACPDVDVLHNTTRDEEYRERSFRLKENRFMQYHCKNFPELARFHTPYLQWRCDIRKYCVPVWRAQFAYDGTECVNMQWTGSDRSMASLPLVADPIHPPDRFPSKADAPSGLPHVPLLVLIFTQRENVARRERQRATWLSFKWHSSHLSHELTPWRYLYVLGRAPASSTRPRDANGGSQQIDALVEARAEELLDQVVGDEVTLSAVTEGYENLVYKTLEAVRWALAHTSFDVLLKTDDDTVVHIGRLWMWLTSENRGPLARLYAGRVFPGSQVIRANFSRSDLWHPDWFPGDFRKWAVDFDVYAGDTYPNYCSGGGYLLGREAATLILGAYDALPRKKVIPVEDAFVGVLAHSKGIEPIAAPNFQDPPRGSLQTRDNFIDQVLVHRVVVRCLVDPAACRACNRHVIPLARPCSQEPYKAFHWIMLSDVCFDTKKRCAAQYNRTHDLPYPSELDEPSLPPQSDSRVQDWLTGPIPRRHAQALTGTDPDTLLSDSSSRAGPKRGKRDRGKRKKGRGSKGGGGKKRRLARARWRRSAGDDSGAQSESQR